MGAAFLVLSAASCGGVATDGDSRPSESARGDAGEASGSETTSSADASPPPPLPSAAAAPVAPPCTAHDTSAPWVTRAPFAGTEYVFINQVAHEIVGSWHGYSQQGSLTQEIELTFDADGHYAARCVECIPHSGPLFYDSADDGSRKPFRFEDVTALWRVTGELELTPSSTSQPIVAQFKSLELEEGLGRLRFEYSTSNVPMRIDVRRCTP